MGEIYKGYTYESDERQRHSLDLVPPSAAAAAAARTGSGGDAAAPAAAAAAAAAGADAAGSAGNGAATPPAAAGAAPAPAADAGASAAAAAAAQQAPQGPSQQLLELLPPGMSYDALVHDQWLYRDPQGQQQGPFPRSDILDWAESGAHASVCVLNLKT
jgi:hypothetical protein